MIATAIVPALPGLLSEGAGETPVDPGLAALFAALLARIVPPADVRINNAGEQTLPQIDADTAVSDDPLLPQAAVVEDADDPETAPVQAPSADSAILTLPILGAPILPQSLPIIPVALKSAPAQVASQIVSSVPQQAALPMMPAPMEAAPAMPSREAAQPTPPSGLPPERATVMAVAMPPAMPAPPASDAPALKAIGSPVQPMAIIPATQPEAEVAPLSAGSIAPPSAKVDPTFVIPTAPAAIAVVAAQAEPAETATMPPPPEDSLLLGVEAPPAAADAPPPVAPRAARHVTPAEAPLDIPVSDAAAPAEAAPPQIAMAALPDTARITQTTPSVPADLAPAAPTAPAGPSLAEAIVHHRLDLAQGGQWLDQLARDITLSAAQDGELRFRLNPEHLGSLAVEVRQTAEGATIRMTAETEVARQIIADAQPRLLAEARAQGLRVADAQVDLGHGQQPRQQPAEPREPIVRALAGDAENAVAVTVNKPIGAIGERYA